VEELQLPTLEGKSVHIYLINEPNSSLSNDCKQWKDNRNKWLCDTHFHLREWYVATKHSISRY